MTDEKKKEELTEEELDKASGGVIPGAGGALPGVTGPRPGGRPNIPDLSKGRIDSLDKPIPDKTGPLGPGSGR